MKNKEDKDIPKTISYSWQNQKVTKVETKIVRRDENSVHIIWRCRSYWTLERDF